MLQLFPLLLLAARPVVSSFSLDTSVKDYWYYVHNHLDAGTSEACLAAYSTPIDCEQTLLGMVSSGSPNFNPGPDDLESMCTTTCKDSLDTYVKNVKKACTGPNDGAILSENVSPKPVVPVEMVGEVFRYEYAWGCSRNSSGWCYFNYGYARDPAYAKSDFPCENACATKFMETAHDYPGSNFSFRVYEFEYESSWWENVYTEGWDTVLQCRKDGHSGDDKATDTETATKTKTSASSTQTSDSDDHDDNDNDNDDSGDKETVTATHEVSVTVTASSSATADSTGVPSNGARKVIGGNMGALLAAYLTLLMFGVAWL